MISLFSAPRVNSLLGGVLVPAWLLGCASLQSAGRSVSASIGTGEVHAWSGLEGRYAGPVAPAGAGCGEATVGLMSVGSKEFALDPFQGTTVLRGHIVNGSHLQASLQRQGGNHQQLTIKFEGDARQDAAGEDSISGVLTSGRCRWNVTLRRA